MSTASLALNNHAAEVTIGKLTIWFSYQTAIAFQAPGGPIVVSGNLWGTTTGKHLNALQPDKKKRIAREAFEVQLQALLMEHGLIGPPKAARLKVFVEGGCCTGVTLDGVDIEYELVDYDNIEAGEGKEETP